MNDHIRQSQFLIFCYDDCSLISQGIDTFFDAFYIFLPQEYSISPPTLLISPSLDFIFAFYSLLIFLQCYSASLIIRLTSYSFLDGIFSFILDRTSNSKPYDYFLVLFHFYTILRAKITSFDRTYSNFILSTTYILLFWLINSSSSLLFSSFRYSFLFRFYVKS